MNTGIYAITSPSGRKYIGSALAFDKRWRVHRYELRKGSHHSAALQRAFDKYGEAALVFSKLLVCAPADLLLYEQLVLDSHDFRELYNVAPIAGSQLGFKHTAETKARYSEQRRGKKLGPRPPEIVQKIADARRGKPLSAQARANQSAGQRGIPKSPEHVAKVAAANRGKKRSAEVRAMISAQRANKPIARTTSGYVGVSQKGAKWQARVSVNGKRIALGYYETPEAANAAVQAALENP